MLQVKESVHLTPRQRYNLALGLASVAILALLALGFWASFHELFDFRLAITLAVVEVPIGLGIAWLASVLVEHGTLRAIQRESDRANRLRDGLKKHYEIIVGQMEEWKYWPNAEGESLYLTSSMAFGTTVRVPADASKIIQGKKHLRPFKEAWNLYTRGRRLAEAHDKERSNAIRLVVLPIRVALQEMGLSLSDDEVEKLAAEMLDNARGELTNPSAPFDFTKTRVETKSDIEAFTIGSSRPVTIEMPSVKADDLLQRLKQIQRKQDFRERVRGAAEAWNKVVANSEAFPKAVKELVEQCRSSDYNDPRLLQVICDGCRPIRDALDSLGGA